MMEGPPRIFFTNGCERLCCLARKIRGVFASDRKGQTLLEVAVALGVAVIVVVALLSLGLAAMRAANFSKNKAIAAKFAGEGMEQTRSFRDANGFSSLDSTSCFSIGGSLEAGSCLLKLHPRNSEFWYQISVADADSSTKKITVTVRFSDSSGNHDTVVESYLTDWR